MADLSYRLRNILTRGSRLEEFGYLLHEAWLLKRQLADSISNAAIEEYYRRSLAAGALGGKILGAGGGGFLLVFVPPAKRLRLEAELHDLRHMPFAFETVGTKACQVD
jgi:D-glycero-alpha-D-manno-heptose-7-phosphate kinase